jgi:hypothetical protein
MITLDQKVVCAQTVFAQEVDDEMVLLDMDSENYFGLDSVGAVMWQVIEEKRVLKDVLDELLTYYDVEEERLKEDLLNFVENLRKSGLIRVEER